MPGSASSEGPLPPESHFPSWPMQIIWVPPESCESTICSAWPVLRVMLDCEKLAAPISSSLLAPPPELPPQPATVSASRKKETMIALRRMPMAFPFLVMWNNADSSEQRCCELVRQGLQRADTRGRIIVDVVRGGRHRI